MIEPKQSYICNTEKERTLLSYCQNFHRQFVHLYRDRRPVLLSPPNEFSVEVMLHFIVLDYLITLNTNISIDMPFMQVIFTHAQST